MTIETQGNKRSWTGDGSTTVYAYPYPFITKEDIEVYLDGVLQSDGYSIQTLSSYNNGANIIFDSAPEDGVIVLIRRNIEITQEVSYPENGEFPAKSHEGALDKLTLILLDNDSEAVKLPPSVTESFDPTLPIPTAKKGVMVNADGTGFTLTDDDINEIISNPGYQAVSQDLLLGANSSIIKTANDLTNIDTVAGDLTNVDIVANNIADVNATGQNITDINTIADDLNLGVNGAIYKVNANKTNIDTNAANIQDIIDAKDNAQTCIDKAYEASLSAITANTNRINSQIWAEGSDAQVETLGGTHSAKGWAEEAAQGQIQSDWDEDDTTAKAYIKNKPNLVNGYFPNVKVGLADNLYDESTPTDISSFYFRTSAGNESISTGPAILNTLRGNMVASGRVPRSGTTSSTSGITVNNFDLDTFEANNPSTGTYTFDYNNGAWTLNGSDVDIADYGLSVTLRQESLIVTASSELMAECSSIADFGVAIGGISGTYNFIYVDYDDPDDPDVHYGPYWSYNNSPVTLSTYSLSVTGEPVNGDAITCNYTAALSTGSITVNYVKEVRGTLSVAKPTAFVATTSMNQYDAGAGTYSISGYIADATIDASGEIIASVGSKVAYVAAVGGIYSGYVAYSENQYITRIGHTPVVEGSVPNIGDTVLLTDTTQDSELSVALFDENSYVCVAVTDDSDLTIHPRWSSGQDQDHTYDVCGYSVITIPTVDEDGTSLPTATYGIPALNGVYDEITFGSVKHYIKRIERLSYSEANLAIVQGYGTYYDYDENYIYYLLKDSDITTYTLDSSVSGDYTVNDYGTEYIVGLNVTEAPLTLNISYGSNLKDKLRTDVVTISAQDLTAAQQEQVRTNIGIILNKSQVSNCILEAPNGVATYSGNTITLKAGLKVLMPDGLNADGTLKNIEYTLENDVNVVRGQLKTQIAFFLKNDGVANDANFYFVVNDYSEITTNLCLYYVIDENNIYYRNSQGSISKVVCIYIGNAETDGTPITSNITSLITQKPINLLTMSNKNVISGWGMPSSTYIDLTLGADGSQYTAPANGYYYIAIPSMTSSQYFRFEVQNSGGTLIYAVRQTRPNSTSYQDILVPIQKGNILEVEYTTTTYSYFRFIYAVGSESEAS